MDSDTIKNMTQQERLIAMDLLWQAILYEDSNTASPAWHDEILQERRKQFAEGKMEFLSIEELRKR